MQPPIKKQFTNKNRFNHNHQKVKLFLDFKFENNILVDIYSKIFIKIIRKSIVLLYLIQRFAFKGGRNRPPLGILIPSNSGELETRLAQIDLSYL